MFNNVSTPQIGSNNNNNSSTESASSEDMAQSLLRNLLNQPPVASSMKTPRATDEKSLSIHKPMSANGGGSSIRPGYNQLAQNGVALGRPSLSSLNPTLASALSEKGMLPSRSTGQMIRKLSGPVKLESPVVPFHVQRANEHMKIPDELPSSHVVSYNGTTQEVPDEIRCHLCNFPMKMCYRKSKYKSEIREYPAYRCLRKGCQTFRSVRKVIEPEEISFREVDVTRLAKQEVGRGTASSDAALRSILSQPPMSGNSNGNGPLTKKIKEDQMGTLIYVPAVLNPQQVLRIQQAAFDILATKNAEDIYVAPLMVPTSLSATTVKDSLCTPDGREMIKNQILQAKQLSRTDLISMMNSSPSPPTPRSESPTMPTLEAITTAPCAPTDLLLPVD